MKGLFLLLSLLFTCVAYAGETLRFGIVPQQSATRLAMLWAPLLQEVERRSGVSLWFHTAPDIPTFEKRLAAGEYDFAYMNPYHYTVFSHTPGYRAIAREGGKRIRGVVIVPKASPLTGVAGLQDKRMAFPAPAAFAASILPRASFNRMGITIQPEYVGSHDSVYRAVAKGLYPAGGGVLRTFNNVEAEVRDQLRILWSSEGYTPHAFAAHPRVAPEISERVAAALIALGSDEGGRRLLQALNFKPLQRATDSDWDDVRALDLHLLEPMKPE